MKSVSYKIVDKKTYKSTRNLQIVVKLLLEPTGSPTNAYKKPTRN